jgi:ATP-dependent exoDNAse (exonuclease V) alpha subunit
VGHQKASPVAEPAPSPPEGGSSLRFDIRPITPRHKPPQDKQIRLGDEQRLVYNQMENESETAFVTGKAGTGKSLLLKHFIKNTRKKVAVVAPTGAAAISVGGQTIHSFFGLNWGVQHPKQVQRISPTLKDMLQGIDIIIIDEISMVRADVMDMIDKILKLATERDLPFGGKQIIMFGDLYQLPPVVPGRGGGVPRFLADTYKTEFFFSAPAIKQLIIQRKLKAYELSKIYRQNENEVGFITVLNKIRDGSVLQGDLDYLNSSCYGMPESRQDCLTLVPTNEMASHINDLQLSNIRSRVSKYVADIDEIDGKMDDADYPTEIILRLKVGAPVVMLENNGDTWSNGTLGIIDGLGPNCVKVKIRGVSHTINKRTWEKKEYRYDRQNGLTQKTIATFTQYPVKLAWALTIHKAQGQTYESVAIDMGSGAFAPGQTYTAISRCSSIKKLYLAERIQPKDIRVSQDVLIFMQYLDFIKNDELQILRKEIEQLKETIKKQSEEIRDLKNNLRGMSNGEPAIQTALPI